MKPRTPDAASDSRTVVVLTLGAIALRLVLFLGRGDYVAFDEGWYLLLGQNLLAGDGYTLTGLRHVALSPLFPVLAGAAGRILGEPVWGGRIVAAITAGLLVVPAWCIFRRLAGRRTALIAAGLVAILPSLAPFVAPFWVGWDLWVGAEPVLHLFLSSGIALGLRALERRSAWDGLLSGAAFALAYLARPEAIIAGGLFGLAAAAIVLRRRDARGVLGVALLGLAFLAGATPYWLYLHDALGRWALTGRGVAVSLPTGEDRARSDGPKPAERIERMLWQGRHGQYTRVLYSLDASGTRLANDYWGVRPAAPVTARGTGGTDSSFVEPVVHVAPPAAEKATTVTPAEESAPIAAPEPVGPDSAGGEVAREAAEPGRGAAGLYLRALGMVAPRFLWPFVLLGIVIPGRRRWRTELLAFGPLAAASVLIAAVIAVDPRTQLFLAPVLAFYLARGIRLTGLLFDRKAGSLQVRRGFIGVLAAGTIVLVLLGTHARRLYLSTTVGSYHQLIGAENRAVGEELRRIVPPGQPVMSFNPAIALWARRDWRVLPMAKMGEVVRFAAAQGCEYLVLSVYNPSPLLFEQFPRPYLVLRVSPEVVGARSWTLDVTEMGERHAVAWLRAM